MKRKSHSYKIILIVTAVFLFFSGTASAYWVWTPQTKKFINPKNAVKDSPKEQFDWAMTFYNAKDYTRSAAEFERLVKNYEYSEYASDAQYYVGLSYENMGKLYIAYQNYQKAVDNFPHIENLDEIIAREFNIANFYASKDSPKILGMEIMMALDRAIEIYKKVVDNAPYGKLADEAQFKVGEALKKSERYDEAMLAFQKVVDDYPSSQFVDKAKYEVAHCAYKASLKPAYDIEPTDKAIKAFQDFAETNQDKTLSKEADKTVQRLKDKAAEKSLLTAKFYESQRHYQSAVIYYQDILDNYPESSFVNEARAKIEKLSAPANKRTVKAEKFQGEEPAVKGWKPLKFTRQPKTKVKKTKTPGAAGKSWLTSFGSSGSAKKAKPAKGVASSSPAKIKMWNPFASKSKPKPQEIPAKIEVVAPAELVPAPVQAEVVVPKTELEAVAVIAPVVAREEPKQETPKAVEPTPEPIVAAPTVTEQITVPVTAKVDVPVEPVKAPAVKASKGWKPIKFDSSPKKITKKGPSSEKKEGVKILGLGKWNPLKFDSSPKPKAVEPAPTPVVAAPVVAEPVAAPVASEIKVQETPKSAYRRKQWKPFKFESKPKPKEQSAKAEVTETKTTKSSDWKPLNFTESTPKKRTYRKKTRVKILGHRVWNPFASKSKPLPKPAEPVTTPGVENKVQAAAAPVENAEEQKIQEVR